MLWRNEVVENGSGRRYVGVEKRRGGKSRAV
jgi:hypothetical protein